MKKKYKLEQCTFNIRLKICLFVCVFVCVCSERCGEPRETMWTLTEKDPDLVQTQKKPGPTQQHQKVL